MTIFFSHFLPKVTRSWDTNEIILDMNTLDLISVGQVIIRDKLANYLDISIGYLQDSVHPSPFYVVFPSHTKLESLGQSLCSHSNLQRSQL